MSDVIFVRPHYDYDSYKDLWRLIELSGYPLIFYEDIDRDSDNFYILTVLNGEIGVDGWGDNPRATIALYDIEWRLKESSYEWPDSDLVLPKGVTRIFAADKWYAERIGAQYVPMGSHVGLVGTAQTDETFDVATMCYIWGRRGNVLADIQAKGMTIAPNAWGEERDAILKSSCAMLHIHQHAKVHTVAPLRYAIAAAWHKPLISEEVYDRGIFTECVLYADYSVMAEYTANMARRYPHLLESKADELHDMLCISGNFRSYIEAAL
jgi:hypothetical protein